MARGPLLSGGVCGGVRNRRRLRRAGHDRHRRVHFHGWWLTRHDLLGHRHHLLLQLHRHRRMHGRQRLAGRQSRMVRVVLLGQRRPVYYTSSDCSASSAYRVTQIPTACTALNYGGRSICQNPQNGPAYPWSEFPPSASWAVKTEYQDLASSNSMGSTCAVSSDVIITSANAYKLNSCRSLEAGIGETAGRSSGYYCSSNHALIGEVTFASDSCSAGSAYSTYLSSTTCLSDGRSALETVCPSDSELPLLPTAGTIIYGNKDCTTNPNVPTVYSLQATGTCRDSQASTCTIHNGNYALLTTSYSDPARLGRCTAFYSNSSLTADLCNDHIVRSCNIPQLGRNGPSTLAPLIPVPTSDPAATIIYSAWRTNDCTTGTGSLLMDPVVTGVCTSGSSGDINRLWHTYYCSPTGDQIYQVYYSDSACSVATQVTQTPTACTRRNYMNRMTCVNPSLGPANPTGTFPPADWAVTTNYQDQANPSTTKTCVVAGDVIVISTTAFKLSNCITRQAGIGKSVSASSGIYCSSDLGFFGAVTFASQSCSDGTAVSASLSSTTCRTSEGGFWPYYIVQSTSCPSGSELPPLLPTSGYIEYGNSNCTENPNVPTSYSLQATDTCLDSNMFTCPNHGTQTFVQVRYSDPATVGKCSQTISTTVLGTLGVCTSGRKYSCSISQLGEDDSSSSTGSSDGTDHKEKEDGTKGTVARYSDSACTQLVLATSAPVTINQCHASAAGSLKLTCNPGTRFDEWNDSATCSGTPALSGSTTQLDSQACIPVSTDSTSTPIYVRVNCDSKSAGSVASTSTVVWMMAAAVAAVVTKAL